MTVVRSKLSLKTSKQRERESKKEKKITINARNVGMTDVVCVVIVVVIVLIRRVTASFFAKKHNWYILSSL